MEQTLLNAVHDVLALLALPTIGLPAIFLISLISATLLPLGSEPAVFGYVKLAPDMFWPAVIVATVGNTVGGIISYFMGRGAARAVERWRDKHAASAGADGLAASGPGAGRSGPPASAAAVIEATRSDPQALPSSGQAPRAHSSTRDRWHRYADQWLSRLGPPALLLSWLPAVGDPLCAVAGWLRLSFWPCVVYMAIGKFVRYAVMTAGLLWFFPQTL